MIRPFLASIFLLSACVYGVGLKDQLTHVLMISPSLSGKIHGDGDGDRQQGRLIFLRLYNHLHRGCWPQQEEELRGV